MGLPFYVTSSFPLAAFNILCFVHLVFDSCGAKGNFFSGPVYLVFSMLLRGISFFRLGAFSSMILLKIFCVPLIWVSSLHLFIIFKNIVV